MKVEELTVTFEDKVRELDKVVLSTSTSWATIAYLFQERDPEVEGGWRAAKLQVRRYRKRGKSWIVDKHVTFGSGTQARKLADAIAKWFPATTETADDAPTDDDAD